MPVDRNLLIHLCDFRLLEPLVESRYQKCPGLSLQSFESPLWLEDKHAEEIAPVHSIRQMAIFAFDESAKVFAGVSIQLLVLDHIHVGYLRVSLYVLKRLTQQHVLVLSWQFGKTSNIGRYRAIEP